MLVFAGYPLLMGNASEDLRGGGWKITLSNGQNGVAAARSLFWPAGYPHVGVAILPAVSVIPRALLPVDRW